MKIYNVLIEYTNFEDEDCNYSEIGMRFAKTLYRECLEHILSIIGSD